MKYGINSILNELLEKGKLSLSKQIKYEKKNRQLLSQIKIAT